MQETINIVKEYSPKGQEGFFTVLAGVMKVQRRSLKLVFTLA
jgi:hypothetical protein